MRFPVGGGTDARADIVFVSDRDGNRGIYVMNADGSQPICLTHHAAAGDSPAWSPSG